MPAAPTSEFAFALCQPGMERWLKQEVSRSRPDLKSAFARPGLVTFKASAAQFRPTDVPVSVFARAWGCSGGSARHIEEVLAVAEAAGASVAWVAARDAGVPDEIPPALQAAVDADAARWKQNVLGAGKFRTEPALGEVVLDVVTFPGEPALIGWHTHGPKHHAGPSGRYSYVIPEALPSRAWCKVVEGLAWSGVKLKGETVLELGAAPGGGTRAFVEAGARVYAVDPRPLDASVLALPGVKYDPRHIGDIALADLPKTTTWLACDAGVPPADAWGAMHRVLPALPKLKGLFWTVKLMDDGVIRNLSRTLREVAAAGFTRVEARQLAANRRDVCLVAKR